jgi:colanic acid biosynthesis glycosyl transferase WcaI
MRVLLLSLVFAPDGVSTAALMTELARELMRRGHQVTVVTTTPHYNRDPEARARQPLVRRWGGLIATSSIDGMAVHHVRVAEKGARIAGRVFDYLRFHVLGTLRALTAAGKYDVVLAPTPPPTIGFHGWLLARARGARFVYNVQEIFPDVALRAGVLREGALARALARAERRTYARADRVVVISEWFRRRLEGKGVPAAKLAVIPNFVDTEHIRPLERANEFARAHGLADRFVVLYSGNLGLTQDFESLLQAARRLRDLPDLRFVIAGNGARREWLERQVAGEAHPNVTLLDYQPGSVVPWLYAASDVGIIPLRHHGAQDTFPSKIYSIMASGRAVLAAAEPDTELAWVIEHARCGTVVEPERADRLEAAIRALHADRDGTRAQGMRGREYVVGAHSRAAIGERYDRLLRELVPHD